MVTVQCIIPAVGIVYLRSVLYAGKKQLNIDGAVKNSVTDVTSEFVNVT